MRTPPKNKKEIKKDRPVKAADPIIPIEIKEESAIDKQLSELIIFLKNNKGVDIEAALKANNKIYDEKILQLTKYVGQKIESVNYTLKNKPTSFIFDIKRDDDGYIDKVYVKPNK